MIKMKKILSVISALCLITLIAIGGVHLPASADEFTEGCYDCEIVDGGIVISGIFDRYVALDDDLIIPETVRGYKVVGLGNYLFLDRDSLKSVKIPDSVKIIGDHVFSNCGNLTDVILGNGVETIKDGAFAGCVNLTDINLTAKIEYMGNDIFEGCEKLTSLNIPDGVKFIGDRAFCGCLNLTAIDIPQGVTKIGDSTFFMCKNLASVKIPESVTSIGESAFENCEKLESIVIPNSVKTIANRAFNCCYSLSDVVLSKNITKINTDTFSSCEKLQNIVLHDGIKTIGECAFWGCQALKNINIPNGVINIGKNAFYNCESLLKVEIPNSVRIIEDGAFSACFSLADITISDSVTSIGTGAFEGTAYCDNVLNMRENVVYVGNHIVAAGYEMPTFCEVRAGTRTIADKAFLFSYGLISEGLKSIEIPYSVTTIGDMALGFKRILHSEEIIKIEDFTIYGYRGTVAEAYAKQHGFIFIPLSYDELLNFNADNNATGIIAGATADDVTLSVKDKNGNIITGDTLIGTGCTIEKDGKIYTVIITGEVNGDGKVNSTDFMQIRKQYLNLYSMNSTQASAADVNGDGKVNSTDFMQVRRHFLGLFDIYV